MEEWSDLFKQLGGLNLFHACNLMRAASFPVAARGSVVAELAGKLWFGDHKLSAGGEAKARIDGAEDANGTGADRGSEMQRA